MANDLRPAKDIIKALPPGVQSKTITQLTMDLEREQVEAADELVEKSVADIRTAVPGITIDDANQLEEWQGRRQSGRPTLP
jgi:hypothetical protein